MIELKLTVDIPALDRLIPILKDYRRDQPRIEIIPQTQLASNPAPEPEPVAPYTAPDLPLPVAAPTAAPAFTVEQVAKAGANLLTSKPDLMGPLQELLSRYGVASVKELPTDKLGEFAAELRKMGAKI